jgi:type IV pilus assembly protein PilC
MPVYVFRGRYARSNSEISGERFSNSAAALAAVLRKEQIVPVTIREKRFTKLGPFLRKKVPQIELAIFTRQFSVMLEAGLPLIQGLRTIAQQHTNKAFKMVLDQVINEVESGTALSAAMANHPNVFDSLYTNMVAAGESGGALDTILQRLSIFIEKIVKLKRALRSALIYPITVLTIATAVVAVILWKVVPVFGTLFAEFDVDLPLPTRFVIAFSRFIETHMPFLITFVVLCVFGMRSCYATERGRRIMDRILLKMPIIGKILRKAAIARFTRTLSTLLTGGVPILEGLNITAKTAGNSILEDSIYVLHRRIEEGKNMADPMRQSGFFPPLVTQMVSVGEATGETDTMLLKVADYYEDETDVTIANLLTILEPFLMVVLGVMVGGIVISMYMPLFKMIRVLSGG